MGSLFHRLFRKKLSSTVVDPKAPTLHRELTVWDLIGLGLGSIIGAGLFVITGVAAQKAGPGILISYAFSGVSCLFSALAYSEFASRVPLAGSAYSYAYYSFGELPAFLIGWDLSLEYVIGCAALGRSWSGYLVQVFQGLGVHTPAALESIPVGHGFSINFMAALIALVLTLLLIFGLQQTATVNHVLIMFTIATCVLVVSAGAPFVQWGNLTPFLPFGMPGVMEGSAKVFFAYVGFDQLSTLTEEAINPHRDIPIGIISSLLITTLLYLAVSAVLLAMVPYNEMDLYAPLAAAFAKHDMHWVQVIVSIGAFCALSSSILTDLLCQARLYFAMSRDGLLPAWLSVVKRNVPFTATIATGLLSAAFALWMPLEALADLFSIGTLMAFTVVCCGVLHIRYSAGTDRDAGHWTPLIYLLSFMTCWAVICTSYVLHLHYIIPIVFGVIILVPTVLIFRLKTVNYPPHAACPCVPLVPLLGIMFNMFMMAHLPWMTWARLVIWMAIGFTIYICYGYWHSELRLAEGDNRTHPNNEVDAEPLIQPAEQPSESS